MESFFENLKVHHKIFKHNWFVILGMCDRTSNIKKICGPGEYFKM